VAEEDVNTLDTIRDYKRQEPFLPFTVVMTSGDKYRIEDPDSLAIGSSQLHYYLPHSDRAIHMRMSEIAAVEGPEERRKRPPRRKAS
jgi:hypothetical protein